MKLLVFALRCFAFALYGSRPFEFSGACAVGADQECTEQSPCSLNHMLNSSAERFMSPILITEEVVFNLGGGHYFIENSLNLSHIWVLKIDGAGARINCSRNRLDAGQEFAPALLLDAHDDVKLTLSDVEISGCAKVLQVSASSADSKKIIHVALRNVTWTENELAVKLFKLVHAHLDIQDCNFVRNTYAVKVKNSSATNVTLTRTIFSLNDHALSTRDIKEVRLVLSGTEFANNKNDAVKCLRSRSVHMILHSCSFHGGDFSAVAFEKGSQVKITASNSTLEDSRKHGIWISRVVISVIEISGCDFNRNLGWGLVLEQCNSSHVGIDRSNFQRNLLGIRVHHGVNQHIRLGWSSFTHNYMGGVYSFNPEASFVIDGVNFSDNKGSGLSLAAEDYSINVEITNVVACNNYDGIRLEGPRINARFTNTHLKKNRATGVDIAGCGKGVVSFERCEMLRNPIGFLFSGETLLFNDSAVFGSIVGIKIADAHAVTLTNVAITDNVRGISCRDDLPKRKWTATGFIYLNAQKDVKCENIQRVGLVPNLITRVHFFKFLWMFAIGVFTMQIALMMPPVLEQKPRFFKTRKSIRSWWKSTRASVRIVTLFTIMLGVLLSATMLLFVQAVLHEARSVLPSPMAGSGPFKRKNVEARTIIKVAISIFIGGFFLGCFGRLVSEMAMRKWTLMSANWSRTREEKTLLANKIQLQRQISNVELKKNMADLHHEARMSILSGNYGSAEKILLAMKEAAQEENTRLGAMAERRRILYDSEAKRMAYLLGIPSETVSEPVQDDVRMGQDPDDDEGFLRCIHEEAEWFLPEFTRTLHRTISIFNRVGTVRDLESLGLLPEGSSSEFRLSFEPAAHKLKPDRHATALGIHCGLKTADVKREDRALAKVKKDYCNNNVDDQRVRPVSRYICDWLRATVFTEDPYTLALLFYVFKHVLGLVRVKNNFANTSAGPIVATNLLANFKLGWRDNVHIVEIQFLLQDFMTIKLAQHDYYEISRAESMRELCSKPIFDAFADDDDNEEGHVRKLSQKELFTKVMGLRRKSTVVTTMRMSQSSIVGEASTFLCGPENVNRTYARSSMSAVPVLAEDSLDSLRLPFAGGCGLNESHIELTPASERRSCSESGEGVQNVVSTTSDRLTSDRLSSD